MLKRRQHTYLDYLIRRGGYNGLGDRVFGWWGDRFRGGLDRGGAGGGEGGTEREGEGSEQVDCRLLVDDSSGDGDMFVNPPALVQSGLGRNAYLFLAMLNAQRDGDDQDAQKQQERGP